MLIADASADPGMLATDLVAQAEHDPQAETTFVTPDESLLPATLKELEAEVARARREIVERSLRERGRASLVADLDHAVEIANDLAPEHLQIVTEDAREVAVKVRSAGAIFLGPWTPVPFGDYGVASNHVLPTSGTARFSSGLRAADFVTVSSVVEMSPGAATVLAAEVDELARVEGLVGHGRAAIRAERAAAEEPPVTRPQPRPGLRDIEPYAAPQLDVKARLNTNECPYPLPEAYRDELAEAVHAQTLNRYPDREALELRTRLAG